MPQLAAVSHAGAEVQFGAASSHAGAEAQFGGASFIVLGTTMRIMLTLCAPAKFRPLVL